MVCAWVRKGDRAFLLKAGDGPSTSRTLNFVFDYNLPTVIRIKCIRYFQNGPFLASFSFISVFSYKNYNFYNK